MPYFHFAFMNITASIFAFLIVFLSVQQPLLRNGYLAMEEKEMPKSFCSMMASTCPSRDAEDKNETAANCCQECVCNPFGSCCCYLPAEKIAYTSCFRLINTKRIPQNETTFSSYISDFWIPPERVTPSL